MRRPECYAVRLGQFAEALAIAVFLSDADALFRGQRPDRWATDSLSVSSCFPKSRSHPFSDQRLARTARLHRISGTPTRRKEATCLSPLSRTRSRCRTSGTVRAPTRVAAMTWRTGRTSTRAQRQTSASACRAAVHRAQAVSPMRQKNRGPCRPAAPSSPGASRTACSSCSCVLVDWSSVETRV